MRAMLLLLASTRSPLRMSYRSVRMEMVDPMASYRSVGMEVVDPVGKPTCDIASIHRSFLDEPEGMKLVDAIVTFDAVARETSALSPRLAFLRVAQSTEGSGIEPSPSAKPHDNLDLLLKERDGYLATDEIAAILAVAAPGVRLSIVGYVERLSSFDLPTQFPHLGPPPPPVCVHAIAVSAYGGDGEQLFASSLAAQPADALLLLQARTIAPKRPSIAAPRMLDHVEGVARPRKARGGAANAHRGAKFVEWLVGKFGMARLLGAEGGGVLDVAGGSGQVAFELGLRRGVNTTTVDPRPLRLDPSQRRTLTYLQRRRAALASAGGSGEPLPSTEQMQKAAAAAAEAQMGAATGEKASAECSGGGEDWASHFPRVEGSEGAAGGLEGSVSCWRVGTHGHGDGARSVRVKHLPVWFDESFEVRREWNEASVVVGMHPDQATEAIVDLALRHRKPFAVVPCCVFWRSNLGRTNPEGGGTVKSWEQFCDYLASKSQAIRRERLPMRGRNEVLFATFEEEAE